LPVVDELLPDQGPQRLPDRDEADAEELGDVVERNLGTWRCATVEDHPTQFGQDHVLGRGFGLKDQLADERGPPAGLSHVVYLLVVKRTPRRPWDATVSMVLHRRGRLRA